MRVQGAPAPCCPFLGAVCTLQLNQSEAEMPCGGVCIDLALLGLRTLRVCPGSVLPGPQELCKQGPREGRQPPRPRVLCDLRGRLQCQEAGGGLLPGCGCGGNMGLAKPGDGQGARGSGHRSPAPPGLRVRRGGDWRDRAAATGGPPSRVAAGAWAWLLLGSGSVSSAHTQAGFSDFQRVLY